MNAITEVSMQQSSLTMRESNQRWASAVGRPLSNFEQMKIARPFRYDTDTGGWFRVLKPVVSGMPYGYVEVDLSIDKAKSSCPLNVIIHSQASSLARDKFLGNLPDPDRQVREGLHTHDVIKWVLYGDVWSQIDVTRLMDIHSRRLGAWPIRLIEVLDPSVIAEDLSY